MTMTRIGGTLAVAAVWTVSVDGPPLRLVTASCPRARPLAVGSWRPAASVAPPPHWPCSVELSVHFELSLTLTLTLMVGLCAV